MAKLKESLGKLLTKQERSLIPSSFDVVGDIAIFNDFPAELKKKEKVIAKHIIATQKHIKVVAKKSKKYAGKLRTPKLTLLAGDKRKTTEHKESGCFLALDVEKCYFSTRSSHERLRIAKLVKKGEDVLVLFSGVAPLPCVLARKSKAKTIHAVELNKTAHKFAKLNVQKNKLNNVVLHQGDVTTVVPTLKKRFDRIVMPLPKDAISHLSLARKKLRPGGTIHLYVFAEEKEFPQLRKEYAKRFKKAKITKAGHYSPGVYRICLDLQKK